ncbi:MAG TPA: hypothetical protein VE441_11250, partial [Mycobacterium sp.]|nr:hypothetical protein [Mycobacterium sp.]
AAHGPQDGTRLDLFTFIPEGLVHWTGVTVMMLLGLAGLIGVVRMVRRTAHYEGVTLRSLLGGRTALRRTLAAAWDTVAVESIGQRRYREDCKDDRPAEPLYRRRWLLHALTVWGFLGLLAATLLDYGLAVIGVKKTGTAIPIWYPSRLIGTVAGIAMLYGVTLFAVNRLRHVNRAAAQSTASDWLLLILLWITGASGFLIEIALYMPPTPAWGYWVFLFHVAVAMELIILMPVTKFAHVIYRPVALFFHALAKNAAQRAG